MASQMWRPANRLTTPEQGTGMGKKKHYCGFCGKEDDEVECMRSGPCIEVCNECIDMMYKLVHEPRPILPVKPAKKPQTVISFKEAANRHRRS